MEAAQVPQNSRAKSGFLFVTVFALSYFATSTIKSFTAVSSLTTLDGTGAVADVAVLQRRRLLARMDDMTSADLDAQIKKARIDLEDVQKAVKRQAMEVENLDRMLHGTVAPIPRTKGTQKTLDYLTKCKSQVVSELTSKANKEWAIYKGYACEATDEDLKRYMNFQPGGLCPDDWFFVQNLIFVKNCFSLPKRRCLNRTPVNAVEPLPRPRSLFSPAALINSNVRWDQHFCKSYACLNRRKEGDCRTCFNMTIENMRWKSTYRGAIPIRTVIKTKKGSLRIGLDVGRGSGSFAAHMARYNVTILTMAMNIETRSGLRVGLPYMETIAQRGLIPLHVPHKARLPFFDNTLDIIHTVNSIRYLPLIEFEEVLFEWDRVLRSGGILWFEMFHAPLDEMKVYVEILELLGYEKLIWQVTDRPAAVGTKAKASQYLNCLLEKPARLDE